jgi:hypothetical protein
MGHDGPYGKECRDTPVETEKPLKPKGPGEQKPEFTEPRPVTRADLDLLTIQIGKLSAAVQTIILTKATPAEPVTPLSTIITPGRARQLKHEFPLPPPSWPANDLGKTDVTSGADGVGKHQQSGPTGPSPSYTSVVGDSAGATGAVGGASGAGGTSVDSPRVTTQSLARNKELAALLSEYNASGVKDLLTAQ